MLYIAAELTEGGFILGGAAMVTAAMIPGSVGQEVPLSPVPQSNEGTAEIESKPSSPTRMLTHEQRKAWDEMTQTERRD